MSEQQADNSSFQIQRIYIKDLSFETPNSPLSFQQEWQPEFKLDLQTLANQLQEGVQEVVLQVTVTAMLGESAAFLCQVQQAGIFVVTGFPEEALAHCLGAYCPSILFPYARECISSMVSRGGFPQLAIAPVNFEALFADYLQQKQTAQNSQNPVTQES